MKLSISLYRNRTAADKDPKPLIQVRVHELQNSTDLFVTDFLNHDSIIIDDRSNGRTRVANYEFDKSMGIFGNYISVYLVFTKEYGMLVVGIFHKSADSGDGKDIILFELPIEGTSSSIERAGQLGYKINLPDEETQWLDSDFISETYHGGSTVVTTDTSTTYSKTVGENYTVFVVTD